MARIEAKVLLVSMMLLLGGCSSMPDDKLAAAQNNANGANGEGSASVEESAEYYDDTDSRDPIEDFNRPIFDFNWKVLDQYILKPVAIGYGNYVPAPVRTGLLNVVLNLEEPVNLVNDILQFKIKDAGVTTGRFLINSTIGLLGIFDVAGELGLERKEEDFAQTLGVWGVDHGAYLMLPGAGPSTAKDLTGDIIDSAAFGFNMLSWPQSLLKLTIKTLDTRVDLLSQEQLLNDAIDPYLFTKELYLQRQDYKLYDGDVPENEDEFEGIDEDELDEEDEDL
jgi:phospholipid-binding lipoprotein MlaA